MPVHIRQNVQNIVAYRPGRPIEDVQRELGISDVVKLASNENPIGPSPLAIEAIRSATKGVNIYPDAGGFALRRALADRFSMPLDQIVLGNGSDEILSVLGHLFLAGPGDKILFGWPSFLRYPLMAAISDACAARVPLTPDWQYDISAMIGAMTDEVRLVMLANPNNPTGVMTRSIDIERLLAAMPVGAVLVLDEAYYDFAAGVDGYPDSLAWVRAGLPIVVTRTFSKSYGLAGIRIGYAFAPVDVAEAYNRVREPFSVNSLALVAGHAALSDDKHLAATLAVNKIGKERIVEWMQSHGFATIDSHANFVCVEVPGNSDAVADALLREGVIVRSGVGLGLPNHLRISIGKPEEIERFLTAFGRIFDAIAPV